MVQFRPAAVRGQYDPPVVEDISAGMSADMQRQLTLAQNYTNQVNQQLQQEVENSKRTTQNDALMQSLSTFSKTAAKAVQDNLKTTLKDIEDGETWNYLFGADNPGAVLAEEVATEAAELQTQQASNEAKQLEAATGSPVLGYEYFKRNEGVGKGLRNETALLQQAKSTYGAFLQGWRDSDVDVTLGGQTKKIYEWYESTDGAAIAALNQLGRQQFIKQNGLQFTTKRNFVKYLGETMPATEGAIASNTLSANIAQARKDEAIRLGSIISDAAASGQDPSEYLPRLSKELSYANTGLTQTEANIQAVQDAIGGILSKPGFDYVGLEQLADTYLRYDEDGNPIKNSQVKDYRQLNDLIRKARSDMQVEQERQLKRKLKEDYNTGLANIRNATTFQESQARQVQLKNDLRQRYGPDAEPYIKQLDSISSSAVMGQDAEANYRQILRDYNTTGSLPSNRQLQDLLDNDQLNDVRFKELTALNKDKTIPRDTTSAELLAAGNSDYAQDFALATGIKLSVEDDGRVVIQDPGQAISRESAEQIIESHNAARSEVARRAYYSLGRGANPEERYKAVKDALAKFDKAVEEDPSSVYNYRSLNLFDFAGGFETNDANKAVKAYDNAIAEGKNTDEAIAAFQKAGGEVVFRASGLTPVQKFEAINQLKRVRSTDAAKLETARLNSQRLNEDVMSGQDFTQQVFSAPGTFYTFGSDQMSSYVKDNFNMARGDQLFTPANVMVVHEQLKNGQDTPELRRAANALGVSEMQLYNQQVVANGMDASDYMMFPGDANPIKPDIPASSQVEYDADGNPVVVGGPVGGYEGDTKQGQGGGGFSPLQGAKWFMRKGVPSRGAAYMSGNIQQEANWIANNNPWDDVGQMAGGLVSWRGPRLAALEAHFGRPVTKILPEEQLEYMMMELDKPQYAEAKRLFFLPNATKRQLIRASKIYWGYGEEGSRYKYAEQILEQL